MNLSQDSRQWAREAPNRQRVPAAIAGLALLGLLAWVFIPLATSDSTDSADVSAPARTVHGRHPPAGPRPQPGGRDAPPRAPPRRPRRPPPGGPPPPPPPR